MAYQQLMNRQEQRNSGEPADAGNPIMRSMPTDDARANTRHRNGFSAFVATSVFSAVQVWAILVVMVLLRADGVARVALACVLAGSLTAIYFAWRSIARMSQSRDGQPNRDRHVGQ